MAKATSDGSTRPQGRQSKVPPIKLKWLEARTGNYLEAKEAEESGAFYDQVLNEYLFNWGYTLEWEEEPLSEPIPLPPGMQLDSIGGDLPQEEKDRRKEFSKTIRKKISQWYPNHSNVKDRSTRETVTSILKLLNHITNSPPRRKSAVHKYARLHFKDRNMKHHIDSDWAVVQADTPVRFKLAIRQMTIQRLWEQETEEFRAKIQQQVDAEYLEARKKLRVEQFVRPGAEQYADSFAKADSIITPLVDAISIVMGGPVSIIWFTPHPKNGDVMAHSAHSDHRSGQAKSAWPDDNWPTWNNTLKSGVTWAYKHFGGTNIPSRIVPGFVDDNAHDPDPALLEIAERLRQAHAANSSHGNSSGSERASSASPSVPCQSPAPIATATNTAPAPAAPATPARHHGSRGTIPSSTKTHRLDSIQEEDEEEDDEDDHEGDMGNTIEEQPDPNFSIDPALMGNRTPQERPRARPVQRPHTRGPSGQIRRGSEPLQSRQSSPVPLHTSHNSMPPEQPRTDPLMERWMNTPPPGYQQPNPPNVRSPAIQPPPATLAELVQFSRTFNMNPLQSMTQPANDARQAPSASSATDLSSPPIDPLADLPTQSQPPMSQVPCKRKTRRSDLVASQSGDYVSKNTPNAKLFDHALNAESEGWSSTMKLNYAAIVGQPVRPMGVEMHNCVSAFVEFEKSVGFPQASRHFRANSGEPRPEEFAVWFTYARTTKSPQSLADLAEHFKSKEPLKGICDRWWAWWTFIQPTAQSLHNPMRKADDICFEGSLVSSPGKNGVALLLIGLAWWWDFMNLNKGVMEREKGRWLDAVEDVTWVLGRLTAAALERERSGVSSSGDVARAKRRRIK